jgi:hypothetical protein
MKIREIARASEVSMSSIRFYEKRDLIAAAHNDNGDLQLPARSRRSASLHRCGSKASASR